MIIKPSTPDAYRLIHDGILALSRVEETGIGIDVEYLEKTKKKLAKDIRRDETTLRDSDEYGKWRRRFGTKTNLSSRRQAATIFFEVMGHKPSSFTDKGTPQVDEHALQEIGTPFAKAFLRLEKLRKLHGTFLTGISREVDGDRLHPFFNLHIPRTFRGSSDSPNFQNFPVRDPFMAQIIRSVFRPREGFQIVETDYVGVEVRGAACYHKDPVMLKYIKDPSKDMHRDMAQQCFLIDDPSQVSKEARYCGKNMFVFPQFYGDFYMNNARSLWDAMVKMELKVGDKSMIDHLKSKGITERGDCDPGKGRAGGPRVDAGDHTFEAHIQKVEHDFWNNRFKKYGKWKRDWLDQYTAEGGFSMLTGFRVEGVLAKNDVINYPVQGASFHCLLWSLIQLEKELRKRKMKSRIVGQIHDSLIAEVHASELAEYSKLIHEIMTQRVKDHWKWIITPLDIEMEVAPVNGTWYEKKKVALSELFKGVA